MSPLDLKLNSLERVMGMKSELHQRGFLSVRHLLRDFGYTDQDLFYDGNGKPHLKDGKYISITQISEMRLQFNYINFKIAVFFHLKCTRYYSVGEITT